MSEVNDPKPETSKSRADVFSEYITAILNKPDLTREQSDALMAVMNAWGESYKMESQRLIATGASAVENYKVQAIVYKGKHKLEAQLHEVQMFRLNSLSPIERQNAFSQLADSLKKRIETNQQSDSQAFQSPLDEIAKTYQALIVSPKLNSRQKEELKKYLTGCAPIIKGDIDSILKDKKPSSVAQEPKAKSRAGRKKKEVEPEQ